MIIKLTAQVPGVVYQYRLWQDGRSAFPFASPGMNDIYEVTPADVREDATPVFGRLHPDDYDRIVADIQESARTLQPFHCEFRVVLPRQGLRWRLSDAMPERAEDGGTLWHGIISDITARKQTEAALRESEERYRQLVDNSPVPIMAHQDGRLVFVNAATVALFGARGREDLIGTPVLDRVHPDFHQLLKERVYQVVESGAAVPVIEEKLLRLDGSVIEAEVASTLLVHEGRPAVQVVLNDLTARKRAQAALARDEAELATIYDHAPVMMLLIDSERKVRRLNRAALEFAGKKPADSLGLRAGDLIGCLHVLDDLRGCGFGPECGDCKLRQITLDALVNGTTHQRVETRPRLVRGHEVIDVTLLASAAPLIVTDERMVLLCLEDISPQKLAEQRLREHAALLDVTRDAIIVVDLDDRVNFWNRGAEELYGWPAAEAAGRLLATLVFEQPTPAEATAAWQTIRQQGAWSGELRQRSRTGGSLVTLCRGVLMPEPAGEARSVLFTASDITEAKRIEAQYLRAQRLDSLGSLAGGVAHDLNNVFTPIMMTIEMLRATTHDPHDREIIQLLDESTHRGADIVRQLLLYGRGSDSPRGEVNVVLVIRELRRMMQETFPKSLELSTQAPADLWPVHADQTQLHQVLLNLCVNARDAMPDGGRLAVVTENVHVDEALASNQLKAQPGPHVLIRVTDTGSGIPPELIEKIFDPFFTTKPHGQGTGLGLATVSGIVRSHGGFITVKSQPGAGSEFGVYLPALVAVGAAASSPATAPAPGGRGELVLVVDDEVNIQLMLEKVLTKNGYTVGCVSNGLAAVSFVAARGAEVRLIVTDIMMPKTDGFAVVRALRAMRPLLPIVAISGVAGHRLKLDSLPSPKIHFLAKPFRTEALLAVIREALDAGPEVRTPDAALRPRDHRGKA